MVSGGSAWVERRRSPGHEVQIGDDMIEAGMHIGPVVGWIGAYSCAKSVETRVEMFGRDADLYGGNEIQPGRLLPAGLLPP